MRAQDEPVRRQAKTKRDAWLIILMRGMRSFAYGVLAVLLAVTLSQTGFAPSAIGGLITVSLAGDVVGTYVIGLFADQWGEGVRLRISHCLWQERDWSLA
jgi:MFS family permease